MVSKTREKAYALITPARNEEAYIEETIKAVISQTVLPKRWVIVSDGSMDGTDTIVEKYIGKHEFIQLIRASSESSRNFGSKVKTFNAGYEAVKNTEYEFIGNLDADVSFSPNYYEYILSKFKENPRLGIAGGIVQELIKGRFVLQNISRDSVAGAVQLFRRSCYEETGGYRPIEGGGVDAVAEIMARMRGWEVRTFPEITILHQRRIATGTSNVIRARYRQGKMYYLIGYHPVFLLVRCLYKVSDRPYFISSVLRLCGYLWALVRGYRRPVGGDFVDFIRSEQIEKLRSSLRKRI